MGEKVWAVVVQRGGLIEYVFVHRSKANANKDADEWEAQAKKNDREGNPEDELSVELRETEVRP